MADRIQGDDALNQSRAISAAMSGSNNDLIHQRGELFIFPQNDKEVDLAKAREIAERAAKGDYTVTQEFRINV